MVGNKASANEDEDIVDRETAPDPNPDDSYDNTDIIDDDDEIIKENGVYYRKEKVITDATHKDILEIEKAQSELWKNIVYLANQSAGVEIMSMIRDGRIQPPSD